jgi:Domain of unknown function (DUF1992)
MQLMIFLDRLVEERIQRSIAAGDFDDLPGKGRPLVLDDDLLVPLDLRAALRVLKNSGYVPREILWRREVAALEAIVANTDDDEVLRRTLGKLALLRAALQAAGRSSVPNEYWAKVVNKLSNSN